MVQDSAIRRVERRVCHWGQPWPVSIKRRVGPVPMR